MRAAFDHRFPDQAMTNGDNATTSWLAIVTIIVAMITAVAILLAPTVAELVKYRMAHPKPNPDANQPKERSRSASGSFMQILKRYWRKCLIILLALALLVWELSKITPVTRWSVLIVVASVAVVVLQFVLIIIHELIGFLSEFSSFTYDVHSDLSNRTFKILDVIKDQQSVTKGDRDILKSLIDVVNRLQEEAANKQTESPNSLTSIIKKLLK